MIQDDFMLEFFSARDTVTVNANELQALIRNIEESKRTIKKLNNRISVLELKVSLKDIVKPLEVKLDVKG